ncbi:MAG: outer membrane lipoprotein-sorting protein [Chlorobi bacterium]|nr:outer membrane lipoprotein-sorting protein [Chlorobiota bacterium]
MKKALFILFALTLSLGQAQSAKDVLDRYVEALGGKKNLDKVEAILKKGTLETMGQTMEFENYQSRKGEGYAKMTMGGIDMYLYAVKDGKGFRSSGMMQYEELTEEEAKELAEQMKNLFNYTSEENAKDFEYAGLKEVDGKKYEVLVTEKEGKKLEMYFDADTGLLSFIKIASPEGELYMYFKDYKEVDGIKFPFVEESVVNGMPMQTVKYSEIVVNPKDIDPSNFEMPE